MNQTCKHNHKFKYVASTDATDQLGYLAVIKGYSCSCGATKSKLFNVVTKLVFNTEIINEL